MNKRRIIYLNTFAWGTAHEMFNASLLEMCASQADQVVCRNSESNFRAIFRLLDGKVPSSVIHKRVHIPSGSGKYKILFRYIIGALLDTIYLIGSHKDDMIIMPFNNLFGLRMFNAVNRLLKRKTLICCHGEMESIASSVNVKGVLSKILYCCCRNFFLNPKVKIAKTIYFSVIGEMIYKNLETYVDKSKMAHFVSMDHPYIFVKQIAKTESRVDRLPLSVGTVGAMSMSKGLSRLLYYAELCDKKSLNVKISHTGKIVSDDKLREQNIVELPAQNQELSREQYDERLSNLDYILFFYDSDSYKITASGAIMDALTVEKPIIAIRNSYFDYMFEKFGAFGYLVDNVEQMVDVTMDILLNNRIDKFDYATIKNRVTPHSLREEFNAVIRKIEELS